MLWNGILQRERSNIKDARTVMTFKTKEKVEHVISSRPESDDAEYGPLSLDDFDRDSPVWLDEETDADGHDPASGAQRFSLQNDDTAEPVDCASDKENDTRPRLQRIARKENSAAAKRALRKLRKKQRRAERESASSGTKKVLRNKVAADVTPSPNNGEGSRVSRLNRVAPKSDLKSDKRRKKLDKIRRALHNRAEQKERVNDGSALADRTKLAIQKTRQTGMEAPARASKVAIVASRQQEKAGRKQKRRSKSGRKRPYVGWKLDPEAVEAVLDSRTGSADASSHNSDAQAVSIDALQAEIALRETLAMSVANFQLDAGASLPLTESVGAAEAVPLPKPADVREVTKAAPPASRIVAPVAEIPAQTAPAAEAQTEFADAELAEADTGLSAFAVSGGAAVSLVEPPPPEIEPYGEWFKRVVVRNRWLTWFTTFYIHWAILLLLAAIIVHGPDETADLLLNAAFAVEEETSAAPFEVTVPVPEPELDAEPEPDAASSEAVPAELEEAAMDLDESVLEELIPKGSKIASRTDASEPSDAKSASPPPPMSRQVDRSPAQAVRQGSFSVWTEPPNPRPDEPYKIIIQVRLPEETKRYLVTDLEGVVVGSDGYRKPIPGFSTGELPIVDGYARLAVPIVSADKKVKDTVFIRSRLLKETQKLLVEFL